MMAVDCRAFVADNLADLLEYNESSFDVSEMPGDPRQTPAESYAGHDFWLTRSGHGVGFRDRGLGELGDRLTAAAKAYGEPDDHTPYDCRDAEHGITIGTVCDVRKRRSWRHIK